MGPLREYRNSLIYGQGLDAGFTSDGKLFIGNPASGVPVDLSGESVELRLTDRAAWRPKHRHACRAHDAAGKELAADDAATTFRLRQSRRQHRPGGQFRRRGGNGAGSGRRRKKPKPKRPTARRTPAAGQFWFADWKLSGSRAGSARRPRLRPDSVQPVHAQRRHAQDDGPDAAAGRQATRKRSVWKSSATAAGSRSARRRSIRPPARRRSASTNGTTRSEAPYRLAYTLKRPAARTSRAPLDRHDPPRPGRSAGAHRGRRLLQHARGVPQHPLHGQHGQAESRPARLRRRSVLREQRRLRRAASAAGAGDSRLSPQVVSPRLDLARADPRPAEHFDSRRSRRLSRQQLGRRRARRRRHAGSRRLQHARRRGSTSSTRRRPRIIPIRGTRRPCKQGITRLFRPARLWRRQLRDPRRPPVQERPRRQGAADRQPRRSRRRSELGPEDGRRARACSCWAPTR